MNFTYIYVYTKDKCDLLECSFYRQLFLSFIRICALLFCMNQSVCGELWNGRATRVFLSLSRIPAITSRISRRTANERGGGLLLSLVQRSRFDADAWRRRRCLDIGIVVVVVATSRNLPWEMREVYSRIAFPLGEILTDTARHVASPDEWTHAKTRT